MSPWSQCPFLVLTCINGHSKNQSFSTRSGVSADCSASTLSSHHFVLPNGMFNCALLTMITMQNFLHIPISWVTSDVVMPACPAQVSSYFVLFFVPYICISWNLQPNRDDCWYDGPIGHWKIANGRDDEYSVLNIEGCPSWLVERFRTFQNLSDFGCNFTKTCFGIFEITNEMHILRIQRLLIPTLCGVFQPISVASNRILRYCGLCNHSCHQYLACRSQTKLYLWSASWKWILAILFLLRQF